MQSDVGHMRPEALERLMVDRLPGKYDLPERAVDHNSCDLISRSMRLGTQ
jgi:hypothetical protein